MAMRVQHAIKGSIPTEASRHSNQEPYGLQSSQKKQCLVFYWREINRKKINCKQMAQSHTHKVLKHDAFKCAELLVSWRTSEDGLTESSPDGQIR